MQLLLSIFSRFVIRIETTSNFHFHYSGRKMQIFRCILCELVYLFAFIQCNSRHNLYERHTDENEQQLLNILKDHDIIPDILDDALETSSLEVYITIFMHFEAF